MAKELARALAAPLVASSISRLLVDLNRSIGHPHLFSTPTRDLSARDREQILDGHYLPYRKQVAQYVERAVRNNRRVIHVSSHSFTPVLRGHVRTADVGLLYDPARPGEAALCTRWKAALAQRAPRLRVRRNYPYAGTGDGVTSSLRARHAPDAYIGVELEVNQRIARGNGRRWAALQAVLVQSLRAALAN